MKLETLYYQLVKKSDPPHGVLGHGKNALYYRAVLSAVQNYKNETRAKFVDGHGESRPLLTISGGLLSQVALIFQISESSNYTGTAIKHK